MVRVMVRVTVKVMVQVKARFSGAIFTDNEPASKRL